MKIIGTKEEIEQLNLMILNNPCNAPINCIDCICQGCSRINHISELDKIEIEVIDDESK